MSSILEAVGDRIVVASGKRKTARATAVIRRGSGRVFINGVPLEILPVEMARMKIEEPLLLAGRLRNLVDIHVNVKGGGFMGQAEAARIAIARGLVEFFSCEDETEVCKSLREVGEKLRRVFEEYDRHMLVGDPRRTESEKPMRYSARRRKQRSYR
ncbi:MAG: 30S ribosomal protein S9 [Acidilobaceae archaeon]